MTYISWSSDFALYLEDYLIYEHYTLGLWVSMTRCLTEKNVGHCDLYFMVKCFCLISWKLFSNWTSNFWTMSKYDPTSDLKIFIGHCDIYFMVQWFCLTSWKGFDVWTLYFVIMSQCNAAFALKRCRSQRSFFHGPVILPYILNRIWWVTTILCDNDSY